MAREKGERRKEKRGSVWNVLERGGSDRKKRGKKEKKKKKVRVRVWRRKNEGEKTKEIWIKNKIK